MDTPKVFFPWRRTLPKAAAFWILAVLFLMLFFASAAASPLYPVYQVQFDFSAATLTVMPPGPCTGPPCLRATDPPDGSPATTAKSSG